VRARSFFIAWGIIAVIIIGILGGELNASCSIRIVNSPVLRIILYLLGNTLTCLIVFSIYLYALANFNAFYKDYLKENSRFLTFSQIEMIEKSNTV
jgi:hypothetical protein